MESEDDIIYHALKEDQQRLITAYFKEKMPEALGFLKSIGCNDRYIQEEIYLDAFTSMYINVKNEKFQPKRDVQIKSYLFQICKYIWYNKARKLKMHREVISQLETEVSEMESTVLFQEEKQQLDELQRMKKALSSLGNKCQHILRRFYWEGVSLKMIAQDLRINEASAKNAKYRCMQRLRERYRQNKMKISSKTNDL